ncbi:MAG TPA: serine hydrolase domain-containing protein [Gemmatimonadaceae bacterium]
MTQLRRTLTTVVLALSSALPAASAGAQSSAPDLDAIVRKIIHREQVVGASVLVARDGKILLHKGYGSAELAFDVPAKDETLYHIVGPMLPFTGVAIMQLVERGKLTLDAEIGPLVPDFPLQGHHVTVRELLNHTSGIVDYHYLGDAIDGTSRTPRSLPDLIALFSKRPWVHDPGTTWDWSISGFALLASIVEKVSGQSYDDYLKQNIFGPAGLKSTALCDDFTFTRGLSPGYRRSPNGHVQAAENDMAFSVDQRYCSTVGDLYLAWRALREHKLLSAESLTLMSTAVGPTLKMSPTDPDMHYGLALTLNHEDAHRSVGQHGSLLGFASAMYEFPEDKITIIVLTNTESQNAYAIERALARALLGLPELPSAPAAQETRALADEPVTAAVRAQLVGSFTVKYDVLPADLHGSYAQYRRTYKVFDQNGRLMIEAFGQGAERLLKQADGSFATASSPRTKITFEIENDRASRMIMQSPGAGRVLAGNRN